MILAVENLSKAFQGLQALAPLSFQIENGITAFIGPNGAGKTTLFNLLSGIYAPSSGSIRHRGEDITSLSVADRHELRIRLKKLRYTAEFFAPFFERARVDKFVTRLSRMQDILGALNDVAVAKKTLDTLISENTPGDGHAGSDISFAAGIVYGWHLERAAHTWRDAVKRWKKFAGTREFWTPGAAR